MSRNDHDLSPETRDLLARGKDGHALSPAHKRALRRAVLANVALGGAAVTTSASAAAAWTGVVVKILMSATVLVLAGGAYAVATRPAAVKRPAIPASQASGSVRSVPPLPPPVAAPVASIAKPSVAPSIPTAQPSPVVTPPDPVASAGARVEPRIQVTFAPLDTPPPQSAAPLRTGPSPASPTSLEAEATLIREADQALKLGDAAGALRLLDTHAARYPASALEPERSADRILALCALGRVGDAKREGATFIASHPTGPLTAKVSASCAK